MSPRKKKVAAESETVSFEQALERLESLVARLEEGEVPLEESVQSYAEGMKLVRHCMKRLETAEATIRELQEGEGEDALAPSDLEDTVEDQ